MVRFFQEFLNFSIIPAQPFDGIICTTNSGKNIITNYINEAEKKIKAGENELISDDERRNFNISYNFVVRCAALDVGRCVLPSSTLTHIGIFGNGRFFTGLINYLKSNELIEANERGFELEKELNKIIPTFIKKNRKNPKLAEINTAMKNVANELFKDITPEANKVTLLERENYLTEIVSSILFPYTNLSLQQINSIKKQKQLLTENLKAYFQIYNDEPFYDYKKESTVQTLRKD